MRAARVLVWLVAGAVLGCGGPSEAQKGVEETVDREVAAAVAEAEDPGDGTSEVAGAPRVGDRYQRTIDRAWAKAVAGENPAFACAGLKGRVMAGGGEVDAEAPQALYACNVTIPVRYFEGLADRVAAGEATCQNLRMELLTQLPAMTLSIDGLEGMIASVEEGGDEQAAATEALTGAVDDATRDKGLADPKKAVQEQLAPRLAEVCPAGAG